MNRNENQLLAQLLVKDVIRHPAKPETRLGLASACAAKATVQFQSALIKPALSVKHRKSAETSAATCKQKAQLQLSLLNKQLATDCIGYLTEERTDAEQYFAKYRLDDIKCQLEGHSEKFISLVKKTFVSPEDIFFDWEEACV